MKKINRNSKMEILEKALLLASETIFSIYEEKCPIAFENVLGNYKIKCSSCKMEDAIFCWRDFFIQQAKDEIIEEIYQKL